MHIEAAVIYLKRYDLKNVKRVLDKPMMFLVTSYCLTITYDQAGFLYISLRNHVQKYYVFSSHAPYAPSMSTPLFTGCRLSTGGGITRNNHHIGTQYIKSIYSSINI